MSEAFESFIDPQTGRGAGYRCHVMNGALVVYRMGADGKPSPADQPPHEVMAQVVLQDFLHEHGQAKLDELVVIVVNDMVKQEMRPGKFAHLGWDASRINEWLRPRQKR